jgi:hypothetical protein
MVAGFLEANHKEIRAAFEGFRRELDDLIEALASGPAALEAALEAGREERARVLGDAPGTRVTRDR